MKVTFVDGITVVNTSVAAKVSNTGLTGIHLCKNGTYQVCKGKDMLGWRKSLDEAVALRAEADRRKVDGTYDAWLADIHSARRHKTDRG